MKRIAWKNIGRAGVVAGLLLAGVSMGGCVQRELSVTSEPAGALVFLNDQEIGRTPVTRPFVFYGTYDVVLRKEGYETLKVKHLVLAPWWQWVPADLVAEFFPLTDRQSANFVMKPVSGDPVNSAEMINRAVELRGRFKEMPSTVPAAGAATEPSGAGGAPATTGPATGPSLQP